MTHNAAILYHITTPQSWHNDGDATFYQPPSLAAEGFIHASIPAQLTESANIYFKNQAEIWILELVTARLTVPVVWEWSQRRRNDFPHLYGPLRRDEVASIHKVFALADGRFDPLSAI